MKKDGFVFISDFDGTLSTKDFYQMMMDKYLGEEGVRLFKAWRAGEYLDKDFLGIIYSSINRSEEEIMEDILEITFEEGALEFIRKVKNLGGEFVILSAGTSYYIERILKEYHIEDITLFSNPGIYRDRGIHLQIDKESRFYSERYGIDKAKVVEEYKEKYNLVFYAGDSQPDIAPSKVADIAFAKPELVQMLEKENIPCIPISSFIDIEAYLVKEGLLHGC